MVVVVEKEQIRGAPPRAGIRGVVVVVWSEAREGPGRGRYELASAVAKLSWAPCFWGGFVVCGGMSGKGCPL